MSGLSAGYLNEIEKIFKRKKYIVLMILTGIFCVVAGVLANVANTRISMVVSSLPIWTLSITAFAILPLIIFMAVADLFTAEQESGCIKAVVTRPVDHYSIFIAKVLAILTYCAAVFAVSMAISSTTAMIVSGMSPKNIVETCLAYIVSLVPLIPIILFSAMISQLVKSSSATTILSVLGYIATIALGTILPQIYSMLFTSYTGWYKLFIGASMPVMPVLNVLCLLAAYSLIFFAISCSLFKNKEY